MKLAGIFRDLEQLYDFQTIGYGSHFVFQNEAKILHRQVFIAINIPYKFREDIFINEWDVQVYVETWQTNGCTHKQMHVWKVFYNLSTMAFAFHGLSLHSEAIAPIIREK